MTRVRGRLVNRTLLAFADRLRAGSDAGNVPDAGFELDEDGLLVPQQVEDVRVLRLRVVAGDVSRHLLRVGAGHFRRVPVEVGRADEPGGFIPVAADGPVGGAGRGSAP